MKRIVLIILLLLSVVLQTAVLPSFSLKGVFPNLLLIIIVSFCFSKNFLEASVWAVAGGVMLDLFSAKSFGLTALALMATIILIYFASEILESDKYLSKLILAGSSVLIYYCAIVIFSKLFDLMKLSDNSLYLDIRIITVILASIIINAVLIILISPFISLFNEWLVKIERRLETKYL